MNKTVMQQTKISIGEPKSSVLSSFRQTGHNCKCGRTRAGRSAGNQWEL